MKKVSLLLAAMYYMLCVDAQNKANIWMGGEHGAIDFNGDSAVSFFRPESSTVWRTSASICDASGNLLFYTNGFSIFNLDFEMMQNGDSLDIGDYLAWGYDLLAIPDGAIIIPVPEYENQFYIFHFDLHYILTPLGSVLYPSHLFYTKVDIALNGGLGGVPIGEKNISILSDTLTDFGIQAVKHGNGRDWWLICHEYGTKGYYKFLINTSGVHGPYKQDGGIVYELVNAQISSPMKFSTDGNLFVHQSRDSNIVELFDFNRCSGELSNYRTFQINEIWVPVRGMSISPSDRYLYVSSNFEEILQFDLQAADIYASRMVIGTDDGIGDPFAANYYLQQLGPDGKIYVTSYDGVYSLHVINDPDLGGLACNFVQRGFELVDGSSWWGGTPNIPNYSLGPLQGSECDTLTTTPNLPQPVFTFGLYPNPCDESSQLNISGATGKAEIFLYNTYGQLLYKTAVFPTNNFIHAQLPVKDLSAGIYLVKVSMGKKEIAQKLVKR